MINAIMKGERPGKPEGAKNLGFTKGLWGTVQCCWLASAGGRPDAKGMLFHPNRAAQSWGKKQSMWL